MADIKKILFGQSAALTDQGDVQRIKILEENTTAKYEAPAESVRIEGTVVGGAKKASVEDQIDQTNKSVNEVISGLSQADSTREVPVVMAEGLQQVGVDQYSGVINLARLGWLLRSEKLPRLVKIPASTAIFRPEGGLILNGTSVVGYDASNLAKSFILGGILPASGTDYIPVLGYDLKVRPFDADLGETSLAVEGLENMEYTSGDPATMDADQVYHAEYRMFGNEAGTSRLICVPANTQHILSLSQISSANVNNGVKYVESTTTPRGSDLEIGLIEYNSADSTFNFGLKLSGSNAVVYITPIIPTKEVLTRVLNNMQKDGSAYLKALSNIYNHI